MSRKELTAENVETVFLDCLIRDGDAPGQAKRVEGVTSAFIFHPERLAIHKTEIAEMLAGLPDEFHEDKGGGWTFLNACMTQSWVQWGEHWNCEQLLALGIATEQAKILMPREMWKHMPGGGPYFMVRSKPI
jgi:hypothetical protein